MASADIQQDSNLSYVEIDYDDIEEVSIIGEGSFGQVYKGKWQGTYIALKRVSQGLEEKEDAFNVEIRQLSRTNHENIVRLYGACVNKKILIMEYADGGSLYKLLHGSKCQYNLSHAMSWVYQCAKGVEYLHSMKPTPLIHRDLKPPNLLLFNGRTLLKICDFGTVADKRTYMTNNKGSAAWMAPEVFSTSNYIEKCDVYSWSIIFWEVLSRRIPFNRKAPALSVLWSVYNGRRPPRLCDSPPIIEKLIVQCWSAKPEERPTMSQIVQIMAALIKFAPGKPAPIVSDDDFTEDEYETEYDENIYEEIDPFPSANAQAYRTPVLPQPNQTLAPLPQLDIDSDWDVVDYQIKGKPGLDEVEPMQGSLNTSQIDISGDVTQNTKTETNLEADVYMQLLDPHLRPVTPDTNDGQSLALYQKHIELAKELCKVQTERALLSAKRAQLLASEPAVYAQQLREAKEKLLHEKNSWLQTKKYLEEQIQKSVAGQGQDDWVIVNGRDNR